MWKLNKEEYSELCSFIGKELKIKTNWVYHIQGENEYGRYHQFNGLNFNSSSYNILKIYFVLGKIEVFKEYEIINEKNLENSNGQFIETHTLVSCFKKYSKSKFEEFKNLVDIGLYDQEDLKNLELRINSLFVKT